MEPEEKESAPQKSTDELLAELNNPDPARRVEVLNSLAESDIHDQRIRAQIKLLAKGDPDTRVRIVARKVNRSLWARGIGIDSFDDSLEFLSGFLGWWVVNGILAFVLLAKDPFGLLWALIGFSANLIFLIGLPLFKDTRKIALGMLTAVALNFVFSFLGGLFDNALCFIPFYNSLAPWN